MDIKLLCLVREATTEGLNTETVKSEFFWVMILQVDV